MLLRSTAARLAALAPCGASLAGMAACTWFAFHLGLNLGSVGFVYLIFVVLTAFYGGFWQATIVSVIAAASLDYFFDDPVFSFSVAKVADWVELGAFEFTALAISELSNRVQLRASEAEAERRDTDRLYQTARRLLLLENPANPGNLMSLLIRETFDLRAVVLFDAFSTKLYESGDAALGD
jgi:two-component system, OmpR family, sensor histidine kinase KdpD